MSAAMVTVMVMVMVMVATATLATAADAAAEQYRILSGSLTTADVPGRSWALSGTFDASAFSNAPLLSSPLPSDQLASRLTLLIEDFEILAGDLTFAPNLPVEFDGLVPVAFLELADQITLLGSESGPPDHVALIQMRAGGLIAGASEEEVTFRFLDFRADRTLAGRAQGQLGDGTLPRRLELAGNLVEVDQTFAIIRGPCTLPPTIPIPPREDEGDGGGGVIVIGDRENLAIEFGSFDIDPEETVEFTAPLPGAPGRILVRGPGNSTIEGDLRGGDGALFIISPGTGGLGSIEGLGPATTTPSLILEDLGITLVGEASIDYDDISGELTIISDGNILIEAAPGDVIDLSGLTTVVIRAAGDITIIGDLALPPEVTLHIEALGDVVIDGELDVPGGVVVPPPDIVLIPLCTGLRPIFPAQERVLGSYSLIASAARPIEVDVQQRRKRSRVWPWRKRWVEVAILGSDELDIDDIDRTSLRLGPEEAPPGPRRGDRPKRRDVNRDHRPDLIARFDLRAAGITLRQLREVGRTPLCLNAETHDGEPLEGCDTISPRLVPPRASWSRGKSSRGESSRPKRKHRRR